MRASAGTSPVFGARRGAGRGPCPIPQPVSAGLCRPPAARTPSQSAAFFTRVRTGGSAVQSPGWKSDCKENLSSRGETRLLAAAGESVGLHCAAGTPMPFLVPPLAQRSFSLGRFCWHVPHFPVDPRCFSSPLAIFVSLPWVLCPTPCAPCSLVGPFPDGRFGCVGHGPVEGRTTHPSQRGFVASTGPGAGGSTAWGSARSWQRAVCVHGSGLEHGTPPGVLVLCFGCRGTGQRAACCPRSAPSGWEHRSPSVPLAGGRTGPVEGEEGVPQAEDALRRGWD